MRLTRSSSATVVAGVTGSGPGRNGGGDAFVSGLVYGLVDGLSLQTAVEYGAAHGALAMTTPGDTTMVTKAEVLELAGGGSAAVDR